ncbi:HIGHLY METHYL ESTERIFIED SEEDS, Pectin Methylesterase6 [Hibiscus trionum]|uniref:Pectinesterase n=1 Tax=Hibiscus trionum TaxID=183268 RepID=A0A9W7MWQ0_HIBTR|nr:HIGHLY METHYL ESTERIFIED SEEDS, Pectin Methylesterase6 [Hibiscus trionum]
MDKLVVLAFFLTQFFSLPLGYFVNGAPITSCNQTPYPDVCNYYMGSSAAITAQLDQTRPSFRDTAIQVTLNQAAQAHRYISSIDTSSFDRAKLAWNDCVELYEDSVHHLNKSTSTNNFMDSQTWLSAASANQRTCENGFLDFNLASHLQTLPPMLANLTKLISNSLAINKATIVASSSSLADGFPGWLSSADRKLLQTTGAPKADIVVAQDGSGNFTTITEAVAAATAVAGGGKRTVIYVKAGVYKEYVDIGTSAKNITLIGDGIDATIITGSKSNQTGSSTSNSATFGVSGDGFVARDITFENTAGPEKGQAVAFRSSSDFSALYRCSFKGYQDTLYVYKNHQFYRECDIYGTVDFIFGDAAAVLQNCNIYIRRPMTGQENTVTAQGREDPHLNTGIIIHNSHVTAAPDLKPVQHLFKSYLGRPWKAYSRTVFMKTTLDDLIDREGWLPWKGTEYLNTLYYGEYMNTGPGANTSGRVKWAGYHLLTEAEAENFTVENFLAGNSWIPGTGVPFDAGL